MEQRLKVTAPFPLIAILATTSPGQLQMGPLSSSMESPCAADGGDDDGMEEDGEACICDRPIAQIRCTKCNFIFGSSSLLPAPRHPSRLAAAEGRIQTKCFAHPNRINLMDAQYCPQKTCKGQVPLFLSIPHPQPMAVSVESMKVYAPISP